MHCRDDVSICYRGVHGMELDKVVALCIVAMLAFSDVYCRSPNNGRLPSLSCDSWSCDSKSSWGTGCFCDGYCETLDDCCVDYNSSLHNGNNNSSQKMSHFISCLDFQIQDNFWNGVTAVVSCPAEWHGSDTSSLCTSRNESDMMLRLPVTGDVSGQVYRNLYCAVCHGETFQYWSPSVECGSWTPFDFDINSTMDKILKHQRCKLAVSPPYRLRNYRKCLPNVINTCTVGYDDRRVADRCKWKQGLELVYSRSGLMFRNAECAMCNYETPSCNYAPGVTGGLPYSFEILFDLNTGQGTTKVGGRFRKEEKKINITHTCEQSQVYDPFIQTCRDLYDRTFSGEKHDVIEENVSEIINSTVDCRMIRLNESEYDIQGDGTLRTVYGQMYAISEYYVDKVHAYVCTNLTQNYTETTTIIDTQIEFTFSTTSAVITFIGLIISLIGLFVTMLVYFIFKVLRNIPGKIILSITVSLFLAEGLLLLASQAEENLILCKIFAILIHYLFLESFLWMNVMAGDVWFTFSKSFVKAGDRGKSSKRFYFYNIYVRGVALALVTSAIIVDSFLPNSPFKPYYGAGLCWFTNKRGLLVFFAAPVFLIILMNLVFFSLAAKSIYTSKRKSVAHLAKQDDAEFFIYVKLALIMGLTWIFGFLASMFPSTAMWYTFIILNTLQGMFICLGFVFTKKVMSLFRERFGRRAISSDGKPSCPTRRTPDSVRKEVLAKL